MRARDTGMSAVLFVIDSSPAVQRLVQEAARLVDCDLVAFKDGLTALEAAPTLKPEMIFADYHMDGIECPAFCRRLRAIEGAADTPIIAFTNLSDQVDEATLRSLGIQTLLPKPIHSDHLLQMIRHLRSGAPPPDVTPADSTERRFSLASSSHRVIEAATLRPASDSRKATDSQPSAFPGAADAALEQAVRSLSLQLARVSQEQAQDTLAKLLPDCVAGEVLAQLPKTIQTELPALIEAAMPREQVARLVEGIVGPLVRELVDSSVKQHLADALREQLGEQLGQQLGSIGTLVKEAVDAAASQQAGQAAEGVAREVAHEVTRQTVERVVREVVPDIAEAVIKEEIQRLTA